MGIATNKNNVFQKILFSIFREVIFDAEFLFHSPDCKGIDSVQEGIELSLRSMTEDGPGEWIPLLYFTRQSNTTPPSSIELLPGQLETSSVDGNFTLRGYRVPYMIETQTKSYYNVSICGEGILENPFQFRWLQTSYQEGENMSDVVMLDNVTVSVTNGTYYTILLEDCFDNQTSIE